MVQDERGRKYEAPAKIYTYEMNNEMSTHISVAAGLLPSDGGAWRHWKLHLRLQV